MPLFGKSRSLMETNQVPSKIKAQQLPKLPGTDQIIKKKIKNSPLSKDHQWMLNHCMERF